jgi:hypothetical protein
MTKQDDDVNPNDWGEDWGEYRDGLFWGRCVPPDEHRKWLDKHQPDPLRDCNYLLSLPRVCPGKAWRN